MSDNWKNRKENMKCKTCIWFVPKKTSLDGPKSDAPSEDVFRPINIGRCRRHSPTMGGFPVVFVNDWCGDHRLDENKFEPF